MYAFNVYPKHITWTTCSCNAPRLCSLLEDISDLVGHQDWGKPTLSNSMILYKVFDKCNTFKGEIRRQFLRRGEYLFFFFSERKKWFLVSERWKTLQIAPRKRESQSMDWRSHSRNKDKTLSVNHHYQGTYYAEMFSGHINIPTSVSEPSCSKGSGRSRMRGTWLGKIPLTSWGFSNSEINLRKAGITIKTAKTSEATLHFICCHVNKSLLPTRRKSVNWKFKWTFCHT